MHLFSTDAFLLGLADTWFSGKPRHIEVCEAGGQQFRLLQVDHEPPITDWPFLDFHAPIGTCTVPMRTRYLHHAVVGTWELGIVAPEVPAGFSPAPFIDWRRFATWADFELHFAQRRSSLVRDSRSKRRGLERDLGPISFLWDDRRAQVFEQCLTWKSAQYLRSGYDDLFADVRNRDFFRRLQERDLLVTSSLSAGGTLLAVHFGALVNERFYSWIAAYDPALGRYSPGRLLLEDMLLESLTRRHREWDFGIGAADYKWHYATHSRLIGPLGQPPMWRVAHKKLKHVLLDHPALLDFARNTRTRVGALLPGPSRHLQVAPSP